MEGSSTGLLLVKLLAVFMLFLTNGFFVGSEFALVSVRRARVAGLAQNGNARARAVLRLLQDPKVFISATQLGVTLCSLGLGWIGQSTLSQDVFIPMFSAIMASKLATYISAYTLGSIVAFALVTYLQIILGEIIPKTIALEKTLNVALLVGRPLELFATVLRPLIRFLNFSSNRLLRIMGLKASASHTMAYSEEELRHIVSASYQSGILNESERQVIHNIFEFTDKIVRQVMVPRPQVAALDASSNQTRTLAEFRRHGFSRIPIYKSQLDNIVGVVHSKDLLHYRPGTGMFNLLSIARKPIFTPDTASLEDALRQMQSTGTHLSIVVDEHGGFEGIITLEDLLEEIVGEIQDEHDEADLDSIRKEPDGSILIDGGVAVPVANTSLGLGIPESDDYTTIAGFLLSQSGKVLSEGETVTFADLTFTIDRVDRHRVARVRVRRSESLEPAATVGLIDEEGPTR